MRDWSSYNEIAQRYDDVWGSRFEEVARHVCDRLAVRGKRRFWTSGRARASCWTPCAPAPWKGARLTGCDKAQGMIRVARSRVPAARFVEADAAMLPFRDSTFDAATASFVLSHLRDGHAGLVEARRVLKRGGAFAMTSWSADADVHGEAWRALLAEVVPKERLQAAVVRVAPNEAHFERADRVEGTLRDAGFSAVTVHALTLEYAIPLEDFLADREISSAGRFARHTLGADAWSRFLARAREELGRRFGTVFERSRGVLIGLGTRAA